MTIVEYWEQEKADTIKAMENMDGVGLSNNQGYTQYDVMGDYLDYIEEQIQELKEASK